MDLVVLNCVAILFDILVVDVCVSLGVKDKMHVLIMNDCIILIKFLTVKRARAGVCVLVHVRAYRARVCVLVCFCVCL